MGSSLWARKTKKHSEDGNHWAELRIKKDAKTNEEYIDVLVGEKKGKPYHIHIGINLNQTQKFKQYRGVTRSITRKVESLKKGLLENFEQIA